MNKVYSIHYLRGIAALIVVGFHARSFLNNIYPIPSLGDSLFLSGASGVDIFFIISGFIIALSTKNKQQSTAIDFISKRFFRVYPVFAIMLIFFYFVYPGITEKNLLKSLLLIHQSYGLEGPFFGYNALMPAWTLTYEVYFYTVFLASLCISHRFRTIIASIILLVPMVCLQLYFNGNIDLYGSASASIPNSSLPYGLIKLISSPMLLEFVYGMMLYHSMNFLKKIPHVSIFSFSCVAFFICSYFAMFRFFYGPVNFGLWAIILVMGVLSYELQNGVKEYKILNFFGNISYSLYLVHGIVFTLLSLYENDIPIYNSGNGVNRLLFSVSICIVISYFVHIYIEKPFIKLGRRITR